MSKLDQEVYIPIPFNPSWEDTGTISSFWFSSANMSDSEFAVCEKWLPWSLISLVLERLLMDDLTINNKCKVVNTFSRRYLVVYIVLFFYVEKVRGFLRWIQNMIWWSIWEIFQLQGEIERGGVILYPSGILTQKLCLETIICRLCVSGYIWYALPQI